MWRAGCGGFSLSLLFWREKKKKGSDGRRRRQTLEKIQDAGAARGNRLWMRRRRNSWRKKRFNKTKLYYMYSIWKREREMRRWREEMKETCKKKKCSTGHRGLLFLSILIHFFSSKGFLSGGIHLFFFSINVSLARPLIGWKRCPRSCLELMYNTKPEKCLFLICFCLFLFVCTYRNKRSGLRSFISTGEYIMTL